MSRLARAALSDRGVVAEIRRVHDEGIALPTANRIAQPEVHALGQMRTVVGGNHPRVVPHFHVDGDGRRRLDDLIVVVVAGAEHRHAAGHAAFAERDVLGSVEGVQPTALCRCRPALLGVGGQRGNLPVRRVANQRGPVFEPPADDPERVVVAGRGVAGLEALLFPEDVAKRGEINRVAERGVAVAAEQLGRLLLDLPHLGVGQRRTTGQFIGPLQRRRGVMLPGP